MPNMSVSRHTDSCAVVMWMINIKRNNYQLYNNIYIVDKILKMYTQQQIEYNKHLIRHVVNDH